MSAAWNIARICAVLALLAAAAAMLADGARLPLQLRGIARILGRGGAADRKRKPPPAWKRAAAFLFVLAAFALCVI